VVGLFFVAMKNVKQNLNYNGRKINNMEGLYKAYNSKSMQCLCVLGDFHFKSIVNSVVKEVSLSLKVNPDCPVHGHHFLNK